MWWNDGGWGVGAWLMMGLGMLVFWSLVVAGIVVVVRALGRRDDGRPDEAESARRILDERFARGELTEEEYRSRRDLIAHR